MLPGGDWLGSARFPDLGHSSAARDNPLAFRRKRHRSDPIVVPFEREQIRWLARMPWSCEKSAVKTLSIRHARTHLSDVLEQVKNGEDIGIVAGDQIIQLKPVQVVAWENSYEGQEYGVTQEE